MWIKAYAEIAVLCDTCGTARESISRDAALPEEWMDGAERLVRIKLRGDGWRTYLGGTRHACPACTGGDS